MQAALDAYIRVWSEHDARQRRRLLQQCWSEESEIIGPGYYFKGIEAVDKEIARFQAEQPGFRAVATSGFDCRGSWARFTFALHAPDGTLANEGWDILEVRPDNKIRRVISFWGKLPPLRVVPPERAVSSQAIER